MSKTITDLREKLFETIDALNDKGNPMEIERANAIVKVAGTIIESAKVEVQAMEIVGTLGTGFIGKRDAAKPLLGHERLSAVGKK